MSLTDFYTKEWKAEIKRLKKETHHFDIKSAIIDISKKIDIEYHEDSRNLTQLTNLHHGQRKLFLGELLCITTLIGDLIEPPKKVNILYIGAADGKHIPFLDNLFPGLLHWILYDGAEFSSRINKKKIDARQRLFDDEELKLFNTSNVDIFISDIRSSDSGDKHIREKAIYRDMNLQFKWVRAIKPKLGSFLKFKPVESNYNEYLFTKKKADKSVRGMDFDDNIVNPESGPGHLNGDMFTSIRGFIYKQAYPPRNSEETRLLIPAENTDLNMEINLKNYDSACVYHNVINRPWIKYDTTCKVKGFDSCFDCSYEYFIWEKYFDLFGGKPKIEKYMNELSKELNQFLIKPGSDHGKKVITGGEVASDNFASSNQDFLIMGLLILVLILLLIYFCSFWSTDFDETTFAVGT
jgi:hypothetical protein